MVHFKEEADGYELTFTNRPRVSQSMHLIIFSEEEEESVSLPFSSARKAAEFAKAIDSMVEKYEKGPPDSLVKAKSHS